MQRNTKILLAAVCAIAAVGLAVFLRKEPDPVRPFQELKGENIASASVELTPPGETVEVEDLEELADLLRETVIYEEDNSYSQYNGQAVTFTLAMADGTETRVMAYSPFLVINGVGYRTEYEPCEALNAYANLLLEGPAIDRREPPACTVEIGGASVQAMRGGFSWAWETGDGMEALIADSAHPLDCQNLLPPFSTGEGTAALTFELVPTEIETVQCWPDTCWGEPTSAGEALPVEDGVFPLKEGGWIYEIQARWDGGNGSGGTAGYAVYLVYDAAP